MTLLDRFLQNWRIDKIKPYVKPGARLLDIGCHDGALFQRLGTLIGEGEGIDPYLACSVQTNRYRLFPGRFPEDMPSGEPFDLIAMLAVLEHIPTCQQQELSRECAARLKLDGILVITVPSPLVDHLLHLLISLRLLDGMEHEQHYGYEVKQTPLIFKDWTLLKHERFQLGLNHLFIFKKR